MGSKFRGFLNKKNKEVTTEELNALVSEETQVAQPEPKKDTPNLTALSIYLDTASKKYKLVTIKYNVISGEAFIEKIEDFADSQATAMFKLDKLNSFKTMKGEEKV